MTPPRAHVIADAIVDATAIASATVLAALGAVDGDVALGVIALVAGAWLTPRLRGRESGGGVGGALGAALMVAVTRFRGGA